MSFSDFTSRAIMNALFGKSANLDFGALASRPTIFIGLSTADPSSDGSTDDPPVGNAYARVVTAPADWNDPTSGDPSTVDNANAVDFATPTGSWGTVTHFTLFDALTGGNFLGSGTLDNARPIAATDVVTFPAGELNVALT